MQHVKLARDRRKRKTQIKIALFFVALSLLLTGIFFTLKKPVDNQQVTAGNIQPLVVKSADSNNSSINQTSEVATSPQANSSDNNSDGNATSYDDELSDQDDDESVTSLPEEAKNTVNDLLDAAQQALFISNQFSHTIVAGDNLKDILELSGLDEETSAGLIAEYPELKHLKAGQQLYWILNNHSELESMNWILSKKEERIYERNAENKFSRKIIEKKSVWKREVLKGQISNSLNASLKALGLENRQINQLTNALQWQISMKKLKKGDKFALLVSREYIGEKLTGLGNVEAIHILSQGKSYYAIQANNGRYYNRHGETLSKGFARYPMQRQARISSPFNPRRHHPVTGRIAPHKGVDFSMPIGTPVIAPADGVVEKVAFQGGGAGRYIMIRHGREYQTVYMHLSKPLVKPGQSVKRGMRIALSGNTGRSTGPHLHYEFHINGRPVNPITVKLPGTSSNMSSQDRKAFLTKAKSVENQLKF